jgi:ribosomal protein L37E
MITPPDSGIGFARSGDKIGVLTNRQCNKCGGRCYHDKDGFHCEHCGPQFGLR